MLVRATTNMETINTPQKEQMIPTSLPILVYGYKSPYPTVVIVIKTFQTEDVTNPN